MSKSIQLTGTDANKIIIMPNAVDQMAIELGKTTSDRPPRYQGKFVVMYSGNIGPIYDFDVILQTARKLVKDSKALFVIRGLGEGVSDIAARAKSLDCSNTLLKFDASSRKEALQETAWADVCVLPLKKGYSETASYPIKLLEYFALGKPVIALASGPIGDLVSRAEAGYALSPGDSEGLAKSIAKLQNDPNLVRHLGANAKKVSGDFAPEQFQRITTQVLDFVTGGGS
jgi:glycosyltransferase involved in cell wall biosynthesis